MRFVLPLLLIAMLAGCADESEPTPRDDEPTAVPLDGTFHTADGVPVAATSVVPEATSILTGFSSFEPTIGVTSSGALFMSNSEGTAVLDHSSIVRSTDGGATWQDVTPKLGPVSTPPTSTDPYIFVDQATDRVYNLDMEGLNCNYIQWSDDDGETFTGHPLGCGQPPVLDHPSLFSAPPRTVPTVGYDNVLYLCVNRVADAACAVSLDGGFVFTPFRTVFPELPPSDGSVPQAGCGGLSAHGVGGPDGRAYLGRSHCGVATVAVTEDDGLTWTSRAVSTEYAASGHDVEVAVDAAGNVYALWRDQDWDLRLAVSQDHGQSWGPALNVSAPGVDTAVFPAIAAGDDGRIAFTYYGTNSSVPQSDMEPDVAWKAYLAISVDATSTNPVFQTTVFEDVIARGPCDDDNRCNGVGDFVDIVIDNEGRPWAGVVDVCHDACNADTGNDDAIARVGTLRTGLALRGALEPLAPLASF